LQMGDLELVAKVFNRLTRLERQGDQDVFRVETLYGMLNAFGWVVDIGTADTFVDIFPSGMTAGGLADALRVFEVERVERDDLAEIPPSEIMVAMMRGAAE